MDTKKLDTLFNILEILSFRRSLINSRAKFENRLNYSLENFKEDTNLVDLKTNIRDKINGEWYWSDENTKNRLNSGHIYYNKGVALKYLLWEYEESIQNKGYAIKVSLKEGEIEHISPQTPPDGESTGYDVDENNTYSEDFIKKHLHSLGNLMLLPKSGNTSIKNNVFNEKLAYYNRNPLNQQAEIKNFALSENGSNFWKTESIERRHEKLLNFALRRWGSFDNIINLD